MSGALYRLRGAATVLAPLAAIGLLVAGLLYSFAILDAALTTYNACPSRDLLSWDGNLRWIDAIDDYQDIRRGRIGSGLARWFAAPTWPAFRPAMMMTLFGLVGVSPAQGTGISFVFFVLTLVSLPLVIALRSDIRWGAAAGALILVLTLTANEFLRYALTAMLETQGMFFTLWSGYFLAQHYADVDALGRSRRRVLVGLFVSLQGVVHTKYPYGVMMLIAIAGIELLRSPRDYARLASLLIDAHYLRLRLALLAGVALAFLVGSRMGWIGDAGRYAKHWKYGLYLATLVALIDLGLFLRSYHDELRPAVPRTLPGLVVVGYLPALLWIYMIPTRFKTVIGTQQRIVSGDGGRYFLEYILASDGAFGVAPAFWILCVALAAAMWLWIRSRRGGGSLRLPADAVWPLFVILQLLVLELTTVNRQERHVYHLIPALLAGMAVLVGRGRDTRLLRWGGLALAVLGGVASLHVGIGGGSAAQTLRLRLTRPAAICANLPDPFFEPARWMAARIPGGRASILINTYHQAHWSPKHRALATAVDVLFRMESHRAGGDVRNASRFRYPRWTNFRRVLLVEPGCNNAFADARLRTAASRAGATLEFIEKNAHRSGRHCLRVFRVKHAP